MKKTIALWVALAAVGCGTSWSESVPSGIRMEVVRTGDVFKVIYEGSGDQPVEVNIFDDDGDKVFSEVVRTESGFIRPYNFSALPEGDYTICVSNGEAEETEEICTRTEPWWARVDKLEASDNKVLVAIPQETAGSFKLNIYDQSDRLVYETVANLDHGFAQVYHLQNLEKATFHLRNLTTGAEKFFVAD